MRHLLAAKRALRAGGEVIAYTYGPVIGQGAYFKITDIRREQGVYYGKSAQEEREWYPISRIVSINGHTLEA